MGKPGKKPPYLPYLELKGIHPGDCFCFGNEPERLYRITRGCRLLNLAGEPAALTENDFWERLDELCSVPTEEFEAAQRRYRDLLWERKGRLTDAQLEPLALAFAEEYVLRYAAGRWKDAGRYDEETMRRILHRASELPVSGAGVSPGERRERFFAMFRDVVQARGEAFCRRAKGCLPNR